MQSSSLQASIQIGWCWNTRGIDWSQTGQEYGYYYWNIWNHEIHSV